MRAAFMPPMPFGSRHAGATHRSLWPLRHCAAGRSSSARPIHTLVARATQHRDRDRVESARARHDVLQRARVQHVARGRQLVERGGTHLEEAAGLRVVADERAPRWSRAQLVRARADWNRRIAQRDALADPCTGRATASSQQRMHAELEATVRDATDLRRAQQLGRLDCRDAADAEKPDESGTLGCTNRGSISTMQVRISSRTPPGDG